MLHLLKAFSPHVFFSFKLIYGGFRSNNLKFIKILFMSFYNLFEYELSYSKSKHIVSLYYHVHVCNICI